jgi:hypothetical protein
MRFVPKFSDRKRNFSKLRFAFKLRRFNETPGGAAGVGAEKKRGTFFGSTPKKAKTAAAVPTVKLAAEISASSGFPS